MRRTLALIALGLFSTVSYSQTSDPGCQAANAIFGAIFKGQAGIPCGPSAGAQNQPIQQVQQPATSAPVRQSGSIDTLDNISQIVTNLRTRYAQLDPKNPVAAAGDFCDDELKPYRRFRNVMFSGWDELSKKCYEQEAPLRNAFMQKVQMANLQTMAAQQRKGEQLAADEQKKAAEERASIITQLRSGKMAPTNCVQYMAAKGYDKPEELKAAVMRVAYQAPKGIGRFAGVVTEMNANAMVLNGSVSSALRAEFDPPDNSVLLIDRDSRILNPERIQIGTEVQGFAAQAGTRSAKLLNGRSVTIAEMKAICLER